MTRFHTAGKFFTVDRAGRAEKLHLRGVTYGPFNPLTHGGEYHTPTIVEKDFSLMAANGINAIRTYSTPPRWLLDIAQSHGLCVMAGIAWTQHVAFFEHAGMVRESERMVADAMTQLGRHSALHSVCIGNEIPAGVVRWSGPRRIEKHLSKLFRIAKQHDETVLVTYANYPSTEYLDLPFLDFVSFNVYLNDADELDAYLPRLHTIAGDRPLVVSELGVDSASRGDAGQAKLLRDEVETTFNGGTAGLFIFNWTDEWFRHGMDIHDWKFGLVDRERSPRIALAECFQNIPPVLTNAPRVSVIICSFNGSATIEEAISEALKLDYPSFEVIVVDDGSTDRVSEIAKEFPVRLIRQENRGLSAARNAGLFAATGQVVAYIDDDAFPDPQWLTGLVRAMLKHNAVGAGGPNLPVPGDNLVARCVAFTPGGPSHVLMSDTIAEHIPGCNMAFKRQSLLDIGGFDPRFQIAGDDVDICWRLQRSGQQIAFAPTAQVWHHRRKTVTGFWKQQLNYGRAEADLEKKWPSKYTQAGHIAWTGRVYEGQRRRGPRFQIYHGVWGQAPFQQTLARNPHGLTTLPMTPEWYLLLGLLAFVTLLGLNWPPLFLAGLLFLALILFSSAQAVAHAWRVSHTHRLMIAFLFRVQPLARSIGRWSHGLTPWRSRGLHGFVVPLPSQFENLHLKWRLPHQWLELAEKRLLDAGVIVIRGGDSDRWDLEIRAGMLTGVRISLVTEDMGDERQRVRWRMTPHAGRWMIAIPVLCAIASSSQHWGCAAVTFGFAICAFGRIIQQCGAAMATFKRLLV